MPELQEAKKIDLIQHLQDAEQKVDMRDFKLSVVGLFDDALKQDDIDHDTKGKLARLRARIIIEIRDIL